MRSSPEPLIVPHVVNNRKSARKQKPSPITTTTVPGGPSGIVVNNYSTAAQASSIYLTAVNLQTAYKFAQNGLN